MQRVRCKSGPVSVRASGSSPPAGITSAADTTCPAEVDAWRRHRRTLREASSAPADASAIMSRTCDFEPHRQDADGVASPGVEDVVEAGRGKALMPQRGGKHHDQRPRKHPRCNIHTGAATPAALRGPRPPSCTPQAAVLLTSRRLQGRLVSQRRAQRPGERDPHLRCDPCPLGKNCKVRQSCPKDLSTQGVASTASGHLQTSFNSPIVTLKIQRHGISLVESKTRTYPGRVGTGRRTAGRRGRAGTGSTGRRRDCSPRRKLWFCTPKYAFEPD